MLMFRTLGWAMLGINLVSLATGCAPFQSKTPTGQLQLVANGEALIAEGLMTKDGWELKFESATLNLDEVIVYQRDPMEEAAIQPSSTPPPQAILVDSPTLIDLKTGEGGMVTVTTQDAVPAGSYNAIAWTLVNTADAPAIELVGTARKNQTTLDFQLTIDQSITYQCGDYVGEERKGQVAPDQMGEVEVTLHWDHLFGDSTADPQDEINTDALGFDPLATLAQGGTVQLTYSELLQSLSPEDAKQLTKTLAGLGHVGEGHCESSIDVSE